MCKSKDPSLPSNNQGLGRVFDYIHNKSTYPKISTINNPIKN